MPAFRLRHITASADCKPSSYDSTAQPIMPLVSDWTYIGTIFFPVLLKRLFRTFDVIAPSHVLVAGYR